MLAPALQHQRNLRLIRVQRKFCAAFKKADAKFKLNIDKDTQAARESARLLDHTMFDFVEGLNSMEEVESAFKEYIKAIREEKF
jgi:hypothetical protein